VQARLEDDAQCLLVIIGATPEGKKELVGLIDGGCESAQSWRELLLDLKRRGLAMAPELAVADGALGFWQAVEEVWPKTRGHRFPPPYGPLDQPGQHRPASDRFGELVGISNYLFISIYGGAGQSLDPFGYLGNRRRAPPKGQATEVLTAVDAEDQAIQGCNVPATGPIAAGSREFKEPPGAHAPSRTRGSRCFSQPAPDGRRGRRPAARRQSRQARIEPRRL
jgi:hypothetical protein